jgi:hypothetical protein
MVFMLFDEPMVQEVETLGWIVEGEKVELDTWPLRVI